MNGGCLDGTTSSKRNRRKLRSNFRLSEHARVDVPRGGACATLAETRHAGCAMQTLDYFFTLMSPFSYLGHDSFVALAKKYDAEVRFRPLKVMDLFAATGGLPLAKRAPARQQYR